MTTAHEITHSLALILDLRRKTPSVPQHSDLGSDKAFLLALKLVVCANLSKTQIQYDSCKQWRSHHIFIETEKHGCLTVFASAATGAS